MPIGVYPRPSVRERLLAKSKQDGECLVWTGHCHRNGHGQSWYCGKPIGTHRLAWEIFNGPIPTGLQVLHSCDNPPCWNIKHLFLGTQADNMADMVAKGRQATGDRNGARLHPETRPRGDRNGQRLHPERRAWGDRNGSRLYPERLCRGAANPQAKLTEEDVRSILERYARGGITQQELASEHGVTVSGVNLIVKRKNWKHVSLTSTPPTS